MAESCFGYALGQPVYQMEWVPFETIDDFYETADKSDDLIQGTYFDYCYRDGWHYRSKNFKKKKSARRLQLKQQEKRYHRSTTPTVYKTPDDEWNDIKIEWNAEVRKVEPAYIKRMMTVSDEESVKRVRLIEKMGCVRVGVGHWNGNGLDVWFYRHLSKPNCMVIIERKFTNANSTP